MTRHRSLSRTWCAFLLCGAACAPETVGGGGGAQPRAGAGSPPIATKVGAESAVAGGPAGQPALGAPNTSADDTKTDGSGFQFNLANVAGENSQAGGDLRGHWTHGAVVDSIEGKVIAADTGAFLDGVVSTNAKCTGPACDPTAEWNETPLTRGVFYFEAGNIDLTLLPSTQFYIEVPGYRPVSIAHGPKVEVEGRESSYDPSQLGIVYMCPTDADDSDKDSICDDAERQYGTKLDSKDSDGDALSDTLELYGHFFNELDGEFYDIRALGADPMHADIFLAIRYTWLSVKTTSSFDRDALAAVMKAFEDAPRTNPDGKPGIHLNIVYDERAIIDQADDLEVHEAVWEEFERLRPKYFGKRPYAFHHALFLSAMGGEPASGYSRGLGGSDFVVSMNGAHFDEITSMAEAGTLMHELGHNLGLHHNGYSDESYVPHYMSLMSYNYQIIGVPRTNGPMLDYSRVSLAKVDEASINENAPFAPLDAGQKGEMELYGNPWIGVYQKAKPGMPKMRQLEGKLSGKLDLNGDGAFTVGAIDINGNGSIDRFPETRDDWASITFGGGPQGTIGDVPDVNKSRAVVPATLGPCLTPSQLLAGPPPRTNQSAASPQPPAEPPVGNVPMDKEDENPPQEPIDQAPVDEEPVDEEPVQEEPVDEEPVEIDEEEEQEQAGGEEIGQDDDDEVPEEEEE